MPKSKNSKSHKSRLDRYKANKKKEQESFKKRMIENYIKMQQDAVADKEAHTSTQEVSGPEINLDELNVVDSVQPEINIDPIIEINPVIDVTPSVDEPIIGDDPTVNI